MKRSTIRGVKIVRVGYVPPGLLIHTHDCGTAKRKRPRIEGTTGAY